ncbi:SusC/RagA family TonB-linked outer membrane protein [uncultured Sunxiuqinia sp.]|uniref:SusC/RagA family TonB-linked outer membrane protein n=1 Tax=uncultured Sunxiuqinia sp. TaxID=1573825 RepID=UPI002633F773|nr:SusC/RagA family TonB-linked outer membrane protein [uncultured Sunxiuqinia sp.]
MIKIDANGLNKRSLLRNNIRRMKLLMVCLILGLQLGYGENSYSQTVTISVNAAGKTIKSVLKEISQKTEFVFIYQDNALDLNREVEAQFDQQEITTILDELFKNSENAYVISGRQIYITKKAKATPETKYQSLKIVVTGIVSEDSGESLPGVTVLEKGTVNGTITDFEGRYTLEVNPDAVLVFSFVGMTTKEVNIGDSNGAVDVTLSSSEIGIDEVVVTALGIKKETKALGYAVQKVSGDNVSKVKGVDFATSLTGKIAGLNVANSTEFNSAPTISLRGESPLLVVDGVPYNNLSLRDIAADDIESIDVLKGATASALYGARGGSGAIMIVTKRGKEEGLQVEINSSTMINAGYLRKPEVQTSYSTGQGGKYLAGSYVWGDKMDIGREAVQYNPFTYEWETQPLVAKGKNNLKNFQEFSSIVNTNVSVTQKGKYGSFRTSLTHVYNKGQWPNEKLNKITYSVGGDMKFGKFKSDAGLTYNKRFYPNKGGTGYGGNGYLYNLLIWSGVDFDIRDYKDYWYKKDELSNWMDRSWYENPYYIAHEITSGNDYDIVNGFINTSYDIAPWLTATLRSGMDMGVSKSEYKTPIGATAGWGGRKGYYSVSRNNNFSINNDLILMGDYTFNDFNVNGLLGGSIYYLKNDGLSSNTEGGIIVPGYYSLNASVDPAQTSKWYSQKQVNSFYGKFSASWKSAVFLDVTGRNDWSSTLPESTRSYFYPSVASSLVLSEFITMPEFFDFWKLRGSWTMTKQDMSIYAINKVFNISTDVWNNMTAAYAPTSIKDAIISPATSRSYEIGTAAHFLNNRLRLDVTYYNKLNYNNSRSARISSTTGYYNTLINIEEEQERKGFEVILSGDIIKSKELNWKATFNWARDRYYYANIDPVYSTQKGWVAKGKRWDWLSVYDYQRDPNGNIIHGNDGMPLINQYESLQGYTAPDWMFGLSTQVSYKNLTLDISVDGKVGGLAHAQIDQAMWNSGSHIDSDNDYRYEEVVNGNKTFIGEGVKVVSGSAEWDADGNIIRDDRVYEPNDKVVSYETYMTRTNPYIGTVRTQNLLDKTFVKLRNIAISYALPPTFYEKLNLKQASIGVVGQNLLMWTRDFKFSDPDVGVENINSPSIRYVGFNLKLNF